MMKQCITIALMLALLVFSLPCPAQDAPPREKQPYSSLITSSLLGTSIGILVGATAMAFTHDTSNRRETIAWCAGAGFAFGFGLALYGIISPSYSTSRIPGGGREHIYAIRAWIPLR